MAGRGRVGAVIWGLALVMGPALPAAAPCGGLDRAALARGVPAEATPAGQCVAQAAGRGDGLAALALGDFYRQNAGLAPRIDAHGRAMAWYRLAARLGRPEANLSLMQALDRDPARQMPDRALAYGIAASQAGVRFQEALDPSQGVRFYRASLGN